MHINTYSKGNSTHGLQCCNVIARWRFNLWATMLCRVLPEASLCWSPEADLHTNRQQLGSRPSSWKLRASLRTPSSPPWPRNPANRMVACRMNDSTSLGLVPFPAASANTLPTLSARLSDGTANKVQRWYARTTCQIFLQ